MASRKFNARLKRYTDAVKEIAWKGVGMPDEWEEIETEFDEAYDALIEYVEDLERRAVEMKATKAS